METKASYSGKSTPMSSHLGVLGIETDSARGQCWRARVASTNLASKAAALTPAPRNVDVSTVQLVCRSVEQRERLDPRHCSCSSSWSTKLSYVLLGSTADLGCRLDLRTLFPTL